MHCVSNSLNECQKCRLDSAPHNLKKQSWERVEHQAEKIGLCVQLTQYSYFLPVINTPNAKEIMYWLIKYNNIKYNRGHGALILNIMNRKGSERKCYMLFEDVFQVFVQKYQEESKHFSNFGEFQNAI
jgi:hypothetical protein